MDKIKQILFTKAGLIVSGILAVLLFGALLLGVFAPQKSGLPAEEQPPQVTLPEVVGRPKFKSAISGEVGLGQIEVETALEESVLSLPLYLASGLANTQEIGRRFGFESELNFFAGENLEGWVGGGGESSLIINSKSGVVEYSQATSSAEGRVITNPGEAIDEAKVFLTDRGFNLENLQFPSEGQLKYFAVDGDELSGATNLGEASFVVVSPRFLLDGQLVFADSGQGITWDLWIDKRFGVVRFEFRTETYLQDSRQRQIISALSAVEGLKQGQGTIVGVPDNFKGGNFERTVVDSVTLGYYQDETKILQPIYRLMAKGFYRGIASPVDLIIYLPAVK